MALVVPLQITDTCWHSQPQSDCNQQWIQHTWKSSQSILPPVLLHRETLLHPSPYSHQSYYTGRHYYIPVHTPTSPTIQGDTTTSQSILPPVLLHRETLLHPPSPYSHQSYYTGRHYYIPVHTPTSPTTQGDTTTPQPILPPVLQGDTTTSQSILPQALLHRKTQLHLSPYFHQSYYTSTLSIISHWKQYDALCFRFYDV
ncbi:hypothetical protein LSAT2_000123 [Lamellibrachia satsuma]|nr:hypothetical protein LSAT2_000123 [Lamellibrachia satsuma]